MRLDKYLAEAAIGTRKVVRNYVKNGLVMVNDETILEPASIIDETKDVIIYKNRRVISEGRVYYMFHKPAGCITARKDDNAKTVLEYFHQIDTGGLFPVGRLDKDTEGLLFFTNDGEFDHRLMDPESHVPKTYFFWAMGELNSEKKDKLEKGICISEEEPLTLPAKVKQVQSGFFSELESELEKDMDKKIVLKKNAGEQAMFSGYLTITEGRKHQVKRMLKAVGCHVLYLKRVAVGPVTLDENLKRGQYRSLTKEEIDILENAEGQM